MDAAAIESGVVDFTTAGAEFPFARAAPLQVTHGLSGAAVPLESLYLPALAPAPTPLAAEAAAASAAAAVSSTAVATAASAAVPAPAPAPVPTTTLLVFGRNLL
jgi:hypothetical protein